MEVDRSSAERLAGIEVWVKAGGGRGFRGLAFRVYRLLLSGYFQYMAAFINRGTPIKTPKYHDS